MNTAAPDRRSLIAGLLLPGAGQVLRGDLLSGFGVLIGTAFFWMAAVVELIVANQSGYPAPLVLTEALAGLTAPLTILPQLVYAALCALTLHIGAAVIAGRRP